MTSYFLGKSSFFKAHPTLFDTKRVVHRRAHDIKDFKNCFPVTFWKEVKRYGIVLIESNERVGTFYFDNISKRFNAFVSALSTCKNWIFLKNIFKPKSQILDHKQQLTFDKFKSVFITFTISQVCSCEKRLHHLMLIKVCEFQIHLSPRKLGFL